MTKLLKKLQAEESQYEYTGCLFILGSLTYDWLYMEEF